MAETRLDSDTTKPSVTQPGDGPYDTTDPTEEATSVPFNPSDEALRTGTVNAVKPLPQPKRAASTAKPRTETFKAIAPNGDEVTVSRNIETGESTVK
jgi:hypothetical protein